MDELYVEERQQRLSDHERRHRAERPAGAPSSKAHESASADEDAFLSSFARKRASLSPTARLVDKSSSSPLVAALTHGRERADSGEIDSGTDDGEPDVQEEHGEGRGSAQRRRQRRHELEHHRVPIDTSPLRSAANPVSSAARADAAVMDEDDDEDDDESLESYGRGMGDVSTPFALKRAATAEKRKTREGLSFGDVAGTQIQNMAGGQTQESDEQKRPVTLLRSAQLLYDTVLEDHLDKRHRNGFMWQSRWVRVWSFALLYFGDRKDTVPSGVLDFREHSWTVTEDERNPKIFRMRAEGQNREFVFRVGRESSTDRSTWLRHIRNQMAAAKTVKEVAQSRGR
ncbi:unnamed protein product [Vitrella brassicaformis CCMP3155]|uniref:PH domain-containing protein n=1 Tax=Vitrella brassicaformis (strain CCMP3155) TaxID=1169540 RepID=A0A0G4EQZ9_VITBC|nr:unnamed protein product [Vitrella brassicaformis CCMP3155]|eukprot:CEL99876.1 unnamed protein product [Vitrella brassicaformis CCMP3155]